MQLFKLVGACCGKLSTCQSNSLLLGQNFKTDRWTILPMIPLESQWEFTSFRHELARQTVHVAGRNQSRTFLWSCVLGFARCGVLLSSSGADIVLHWWSWWVWRKEAVIWVFWEGVLFVILRMGVVNCQKQAVDFLEGRPGQFDQNAPQFDFLWVFCLWHTQAIALVKHCQWKLYPKPIKLLIIAFLWKSCLWHDKLVSNWSWLPEQFLCF